MSLNILHSYCYTYVHVNAYVQINFNGFTCYVLVVSLLALAVLIDSLANSNLFLIV